ncbi:MAG: anti-sigma factor antagonist [Candidatus Omnitrophica bacterium]|nr:anti-sigma factor antagonist [Candidatus Omnitrophota bacterium]
MKINIREKDNIVILDLEGNIDINASNFIETIGWVLVNKSKNIICNFEGIDIIDYVGVSLIAVAYKNVINHNGNMLLCNVPAHILKLFTIVGLDKVFDYYQTEEDAIKILKELQIFDRITSAKLRRRFRRIPYKGDIEYKQKFSPTDIFYKGKILNLSAIGAFIVCDKIFSIGEILQTKFYLLPDEMELKLDAKVIWIADEEIQPLESPAMGIEFYNIEAHTQQLIIDFVEKNFANTDINE